MNDNKFCTRDMRELGAVANDLERKGIQTERGNINREIIKNNMLLEQAKEMLMLAKQELHSAQYATYKSTQIKNTAVSVKNEVMEMIARVRERKAGLTCRLSAENIYAEYPTEPLCSQPTMRRNSLPQGR